MELFSKSVKVRPLICGKIFIRNSVTVYQGYNGVECLISKYFQYG